MELNMLLDELVEDELRKLNDKLRKEMKELDRKQLKLNNADIKVKLVEAIRWSNVLLTRFAELLMGSKGLMLHKEMDEINRLSSLKITSEKMQQKLQMKKEQLQDAKAGMKLSTDRLR